MDDQGTNPEMPQPQTEQVSIPVASTQVNSSVDNNTIIVIVLLIIFYPVGLILMWTMMKHWPLWIKLVASIPILFTVLILVAVVLLFNAGLKSNPNNTSTFNSSLQVLCKSIASDCVDHNKRVYEIACQFSGGSVTSTSYVLGKYSGDCKYPNGKKCDIVAVYNKTCNLNTAK